MLAGRFEVRAGHGIAMFVNLHCPGSDPSRKVFLVSFSELRPEILVLSQLSDFRLLHQFAIVLNIRVLQAVIAAHRKLEFFDGNGSDFSLWISGLPMSDTTTVRSPPRS